MGYCMTANVKINIPKKNVEKALAAINALHASQAVMKKNGAGGGSSTGEIWYSWVGNPPAGGWKEILDAFNEWRYNGEVDADGNVKLNEFIGEKLGDDNILLSAIAPFVTKDSFVECDGEDGARWKWVFVKGKFKELTGKTIYS